jgi:hypothetical protein
MRKYILRTLEGRTIEVTQLLVSLSSRISIGVNVWMSSNYLSFLGVVAHFAGKADPATVLDGETRMTAKRAAPPNSTSTSTPHNSTNMSSIQAALAAIASLDPGEEIN